MNNQLMLEIFDKIDTIFSGKKQDQFKPIYELQQCELYGFTKCIVYSKIQQYQIDMTSNGGLYSSDLLFALEHVTPKYKTWAENKISVKNDSLLIEVVF